MKTTLSLFIFYSISNLFLFSTGSCQNHSNEVEYNFKVIYQDQYYELNPLQKYFTSKQAITITNESQKKVREIFFNIHPDFDIKTISLKNANGKEIAISNWKYCGKEKVFRNYEFPIAKIELKENIKPGAKIELFIEYILDPTGFKETPQDMYEFTISPEACYSIYIGCNLLFGRNMISPYKMTLKYPTGNISCVPGKLITSKKEDDYNIDIYQSVTPNVPTFSIAPYKKISRNNSYITVEYYLYPEEVFSEEMADNTFKTVDLYFKYFGDNGTNIYKFATVGEKGAQNLGGENKGNTMYFSDLATQNFNANNEGKLNYLRLVSHEVYHNWNLFYVYMNGRLGEWFGEGGANFISAWAVEEILGTEAGKNVRLLYNQRFIRGQGYNSPATLEYIQKTGGVEDILFYNYGAFVWEQLRQKIGDEALFGGLGDFYRKYGYKAVTSKQLLDCIQEKTSVDVVKYLDQWIKNNAQIDLTIENVEINTKSMKFETKVDILIDSNNDYEIFTSIGFKTSPSEQLKTIPVYINKESKQTILITSQQKPIFIQIDPDFRVPQINFNGLTWEEANNN